MKCDSLKRAVQAAAHAPYVRVMPAQITSRANSGALELQTTKAAILSELERRFTPDQETGLTLSVYDGLVVLEPGT